MNVIKLVCVIDYITAALFTVYSFPQVNNIKTTTTITIIIIIITIIILTTSLIILLRNPKKACPKDR